MSITRSNSSSLVETRRLRTFAPGVTTRTSASAQAVTRASTEAVSVMSTSAGSADPVPRPANSEAVSLAPERLRSAAMTWAPASASPIALAWPSPEPAPTTTAVRPRRSNRLGSEGLCSFVGIVSFVVIGVLPSGSVRGSLGEVSELFAVDIADLVGQVRQVVDDEVGDGLHGRDVTLLD